MDKMDFCAIKDVRDGMKNINVLFIILEMTGATKTKENREVFSFKVADATAAINCSIWDEPGKLLQAGDIVRLMKCYVSTFRGCLTLYSGKSGELSKMGDFCMIFNEQLNMSEPIIINRSANPPLVLPATNGQGNGRQQITPQPTAATPNAPINNHSSTNDNPKPKVNNSSSRNYIRKPINRK